MKQFFLILLFFLSFVGSVSAQQLETHGAVKSGGYNYWLYTPAQNDDSVVDETKPLIIFLHGASLCGHNIDRVARYGTIDAIKRGLQLDAYVIAPQNPGGPWRPSLIWDIVESVIGSAPIDTNRISLIGMSLGGFGTFLTAAAYHDKIAAAMALCGGGFNPDYTSLDKLPLWIIHGTADRAVSINQAEKIVGGIRAHGGGDRLRFTKIDGGNHAILARCFYLDQTYEWLLCHSLNDPGRPVNKDYSITKADLAHAYKNLPSKSKQVKIIRATSSSDEKEDVTEKTSTHSTYKVKIR